MDTKEMLVIKSVNAIEKDENGTYKPNTKRWQCDIVARMLGLDQGDTRLEPVKFTGRSFFLA